MLNLGLAGVLYGSLDMLPLGNVGSQRKCNHDIGNVMVRKHDEQGSTTLGGSKILENKHHPDKLKTNDYFPSCFKPARPLTNDIHEPLEKDLNDYHLSAPNSHNETKESASQSTKKLKLRHLLAGLAKFRGYSSETLLCQQPSNEINPGSFTLHCTIGDLKIYVMADLGAGVNKMPKSLFEHLKLTNLKETSMVVEMADMTKKALLGILKNIQMFSGIRKDKVKFDMNAEMCHSRVPLEKIYMASSIQESAYFNPLEVENNVFTYDSPACLLEQNTPLCSEESIDTIDSSDDNQDDEVGSHLLENVSRWHVCKPVHITFKVCEEDYGIWPTCNPDLSFCSGYDDIYKKEENAMLKYGNKNIDDITHERRYYEWVA
ncbi:phospholipase-like protein [Tanacetum coccineum]